ncbi:MAG: hypothetical protein JXX29_08865 [Deltaproteobacteria bacterium]|nr:hypothetical protein [Deltaproteobacteria bacterium]MBN2671772.1 hypothetical protein [Deltaproteobacteria bacterium]
MESSVPTLLFCSAVLIFGCGETSISPYGEPYESPDSSTDTMDIDTSDSSQSTDSNSSLSIKRIPFVVPSGSDIDYLFIPPESNSIGAQGLWYHSSDNETTLNISETNSTICADGELSVSDSYTPWAAIGISLCYAGAQDDNAYEMYTASECPFVANFDSILVGISFELTTDIPNAPLFAYFLGNDDITYFEFTLNETGRIDLFFDNAALHDNADGLHLEELRLAQFQVNNELDSNQSFHYCISNVELLIVSD